MTRKTSRPRLVHARAIFEARFANAGGGLMNIEP